MTTTRYGAIRAAVGDAMRHLHPDGAPARLATISAPGEAGERAWIQVMAGSINMAWPFAEAPAARLARTVSGATALTLIEWRAGSHAAWDTGALRPDAVATIVDALFAMLPGSGAADVAPAIAHQDLEA